MLVLSRKLGQSFHVGPEVRVTIVKIDRNSVRIGIEAPDEVSVQREEIVFELPAISLAQGRGRLSRRRDRRSATDADASPVGPSSAGSSMLASRSLIH